jgi:hypothetical protein
MTGPMLEQPNRTARFARGVRVNPRLLYMASCLLATVSCNGQAAPTGPTTPVNHAPVLTSLSVSPSFGVSGLTVITMTATATDADNDPLTFTWTFNGTMATGTTTSAKLTGDGAVAVQVSVTDGKGGVATDSRNVTIGTMTGTWSVTVGGSSQCGLAPGEAPAVMKLTQNGTAITGTLFFPEKWCNVTRQTAGILKDVNTIDDQGNVAFPRISVTSGTIGAYLDSNITGKMDTTGRTVTGQIFQSGFSGDPVTMTKVAASFVPLSGLASLTRAPGSTLPKGPGPNLMGR